MVLPLRAVRSTNCCPPAVDLPGRLRCYLVLRHARGNSAPVMSRDSGIRVTPPWFPVVGDSRRCGHRSLQRPGNPFALEVYLKYRHPHPLLHFDHIRGIADEALSQLADVRQPVLVDANIDKGAETGHVGDQVVTQFEMGYQDSR